MCDRRRLLLLIVGVTAIGRAARADSPTTSQIVAAAGGGAQVTVLSKSRLSLPETGREAHVVKVMTPAGQPRTLTLDGAGNPTDSQKTLLAAERAAARQHYGGLKPKLFGELQNRAADDIVPVAIWARVKIDQPRREDLANDGSKAAAFEQDLQQRLAAAKEPIIRWLEKQAPGSVSQLESGTQGSPMVWARVPASLVPALGQLPNVDWVELQTPPVPQSLAWFQATNVAAARAITTGSADVRGCVLEGDRPSDTSSLRIGGIRDESNAYVGSHSQQVMGVMSNTFAPQTGSVTDQNIYVGNIPEDDFGPGIQWCFDQQARVMNFSVTGDDRMDVELDYYALKGPYYPVMVASAGNLYGTVTNKTKNGLVVGATDDRGTASLVDDTMWDDFDDPDHPLSSASENPALSNHDYELPHLVAPGSKISSGSFDCSPNTYCPSGTSFAAPQVAGAAMLVLARNDQLRIYPETTKSVLMATAIAGMWTDRFTHLPAGDEWGTPGYRDRRDGVGLLDTGKAVALADPANMATCGGPARAKGVYGGNMTLIPNSYAGCVWNLVAPSDGLMRVVLNWDNTVTCSDDLSVCTSNVLDGDLDLYVYDSSGAIACRSTSTDSSWEGCDFPVAAGSTYIVKVLVNPDNPSASTYVGLAWTDIPAPATPTAQVVVQPTYATVADPNVAAMHVAWYTTTGTTEGVIVVMSEGDAALPPVVDGTAYGADSICVGSSPNGGWLDWSVWHGPHNQIGSSGWYCIHNSTSPGSIGMFGLDYGKTYRVMAIPYNNYRTGMFRYQATPNSQNPASYTPTPGVRTPALGHSLVFPIALFLCLTGLALIRQKRGVHGR